MDRIDVIDNDDGRTVTIKGSNMKLLSTEFVEVKNSYGDASDERFQLVFLKTKEIEEKLLKVKKLKDI